jgi:hypothetical protein
VQIRCELLHTDRKKCSLQLVKGRLRAKEFAIDEQPRFRRSWCAKPPLRTCGHRTAYGQDPKKTKNTSVDNRGVSFPGAQWWATLQFRSGQDADIQAHAGFSALVAFRPHGRAL